MSIIDRFEGLGLQKPYQQQDIIRKLEELFTLGYSCEEIAQKTPQLTANDIFNYAKKHSILHQSRIVDGYNFEVWCKLFIPRIPYQTLSIQKLKEQLIRELTQHTLQELADQLGCNVVTIRAAIKNLQISYSPTKKPRKLSPHQIERQQLLKRYHQSHGFTKLSQIIHFMKRDPYTSERSIYTELHLGPLYFYKIRDGITDEILEQ